MTIYPGGVKTDDGILLLNVGAPGHENNLTAALAEVGYEYSDVKKIVLTHQDLDHIGCVKAMLDRTDAEIIAHTAATPYIEGKKGLIKESMPRYEGVSVDLQLTDGEVFRTTVGPMEIVRTPGHAPEHLSLYFPDQRFLWSTDALTKMTELAGSTPEFTPNMDTTMESVEKLAEREFDAVSCYHGSLAEVGDEAVARLVRMDN